MVILKAGLKAEVKAELKDALMGLQMVVYWVGEKVASTAAEKVYMTVST